MGSAVGPEPHPSESAVVTAFAKPSLRDALLLLLTNPRNRGKVIASLCHPPTWDSRYLMAVPAEADEAALVSHLRGAGNRRQTVCRILADDVSLDGMDLPLAEAVSKAQSCQWGSLVIAVPGPRALLLEEWTGVPRRRFVLARS
jgi:hypothetical protein